MIEVDRLLKGSIDMHIHSGPDVITRRLDAIEAARQAQKAGMRAIVLKNHFYPTTPLAHLVNQCVPGIQVFGSLCLNHEIGGLNTYAVKHSAALGAKIIWMPTIYAVSTHRLPALNSRETELSVFDSAGKLLPEITSILDLIKQNDMILASGHITHLETKALFEAAVKLGIIKLIITHPLDLGMSAQPYDLEEIYQLVQTGAFIELTFTGLLPTSPEDSLPRILELIKAIGADHFILSTDLGQANNPFPVEGLRTLIATLIQKNITPEEIELMVKINPSKLLGLN
jgi:hypothetical protein